MTFILLSYEGGTLTTTEAGHHHLRNPLFGEKGSFQLLAWGEELEASSTTSPSTLIQFPALGFHAPHCPLQMTQTGRSQERDICRRSFLKNGIHRLYCIVNKGALHSGHMHTSS